MTEDRTGSLVKEAHAEWVSGSPSHFRHSGTKELYKGLRTIAVELRNVAVEINKEKFGS